MFWKISENAPSLMASGLFTLTHTHTRTHTHTHTQRLTPRSCPQSSSLQVWPAAEPPPPAPAADGGADVFLVHGFGASSGHWRHTGPALEAAGHRAFALDLLGFGGSDKPVGHPFSTEDWAEQ